VVVKGTRGNEGAERSGVHDDEQWTKDGALVGIAQTTPLQQPALTCPTF